MSMKKTPYLKPLFHYLILLLSIGISNFSPSLANDEEASSDAPLGFGEAIRDSEAMILRVPINEAGEENTNAAEVRFLKDRGRISGTSEVVDLWNNSKPVKISEKLLGTEGPLVDPRQESSTWGWNYWRYRGWYRPYYYYNYYPTFYYSYNWYYYRPYRYWNWWGYRYYYYNRWW